MSAAVSWSFSKRKKKSRRKKKQDKTLSTSEEIEEVKDKDAPSGSPQKYYTEGPDSNERSPAGESSQSPPTPESVKGKKKRRSSKKGNKASIGASDRDISVGKNEITVRYRVQNLPPEPDNESDQQLPPLSNGNDSDGPPGIAPSPPTSPQPQIPPRRSIQIPCSSNPNVKPTTAAAKAFISLYYPSITHGLTHDLCRYYSDMSQKSISVGGAHSVVTGLDSIAMQITSLTGSLFSVRGVVAQDAANGGAHLLITGVCTPKGGFATAFAHSVGLARMEAGENTCCSNDHKFIIQNDALSLLSGEMAGAVEEQQQLQQQQLELDLHRKQQMQHMEEKSNQQLYTGTEQSPVLLKPPGLFK